MFTLILYTVCIYIYTVYIYVMYIGGTSNTTESRPSRGQNCNVSLPHCSSSGPSHSLRRLCPDSGAVSSRLFLGNLHEKWRQNVGTINENHTIESTEMGSNAENVWDFLEIHRNTCSMGNP